MDQASNDQYKIAAKIEEDFPKKGILTPGIEDALSGHALGQYQLMERLGRGGMATVYKAYQPSLHRHVSVKVLSTFLAQDPDFAARFQREALSVAKLNHPNILPIYDYGQEGQLIYIVMRYVEEGTLQDMMLDQPLDLDTTVEIIAQIGEALDYAHRQGIVHRDVKPRNVLMADGNWALLSDFGLATMIGGSARITRTGMGMGTPAYIAPEQARGKDVDGRSDIYSLGVVLFEMLTGRVPFEGDSPLAVLYKLVNDPPPLPREFNPDIPLAVERVLLKALAKGPADRFQRAGQMVAALQQAVSGGPVTTAALSLADERKQQEAREGKVPIWRRVPWWAWAAMGGAILLVLAIAGATLSPKTGPKSPAVVALTSTPMPATATPTLTADVAATKTAWASETAEWVATATAQTATAVAAFSPTPTDTPIPIPTPVPPTDTPEPPTAMATQPPTPTPPTPTPTPEPTGSILTIYLLSTNTEPYFAALSSDQPNGGMIYKEGQCVYGDAAVQIGETLYHFDKPEAEPKQLPDPWEVKFEFAEELVAHTGKKTDCAADGAGFDSKKAWFWVGILDSESALETPYSLTIELYEGDQLRGTLQVFFTVVDVPDLNPDGTGKGFYIPP